MTLLDWYHISQIILTLGFIVSILALLKQGKGIMDDHEARRREHTVNVLLKFTEISDNGLLFIPRKLIQSLTSEEKKAIIACSADVEIDVKNSFYVKAIICREHKACNEKCVGCKTFEPTERGKIKIKQEHVIFIRQSIITYFNAIEFIAMSAIKSVADSNMIVEQFGYILNEGDSYLAMLNECGLKNNLPCTEAFIDKYKKKNGAQTKPPLG